MIHYVPFQPFSVFDAQGVDSCYCNCDGQCACIYPCGCTCQYWPPTEWSLTQEYTAFAIHFDEDSITSHANQQAVNK